MGPIHESALDLRVSDLLTDDLQWNKARIEQYLPDFSSQIQCIKPSKVGAEDIYVWLPLQTGIYSTKLALLRFRQAICLPPTGIRSPILPWVCWFLWTARNKLIFEDKSSRPAEIATRGLSAALEWDQAQDVEKEQKSNHLPLKAAPTQTDRSSCENPCFVDAAWDVSSKRAGVAWILNKDPPLRVQSGAQIV
ncbi:hypothetical protein DY000_02043465 [Brassica cretica]|uniref:Reverse transcriptase zinc-binding domain-containing protein n=1 Tax=Brassica cretica TaxID=69181 RepID=A0ABQ7BHQ7_BRACR|nr:hypothetical protein DY000_02043465 [Brassica cretica]